MKLKTVYGIMLALLFIGILTLPFSTQQVKAQEEGLVAYFPFNGNANDESGNNHDGTVHGATLATDRFGNSNSAYSFDGIDDYVEIPNDADFDFGTGAFTVSAWIKTNATTTVGSGRDDILAKGDPTISGFAISIRSNKAVFWTGSSGEFFGSSVLNNGEWHHVVATRDDSGNVALYVDGVSEYNGINNENVDTDYNVFIGKHGTVNESYFDGLIDDVSIYNRVVAPGPPTIVVLSPQNATYATSSVPLAFTINEEAAWMSYSLDGQANVTVTGNTTLTSLLDGAHYVVVFANDTSSNMGTSEKVYFTVDTTSPTISVLSPENKTYTITDVPLTFTVSKVTSWMGYSLDGQTNNTITGDTTLTGLSDGTHTLTVYANDTAGNMGYSDVVYFSVDTEPSTDDTEPSTILHELEIHLEAPMYIKLGDSSLLNATVYNQGFSNENDVELYLMVNGTNANNVTLPQLMKGTSYTLSHLWNPTYEATYNVTAYVLPVAGETNTGNNRLSQMISVYEPVWYRDDEKNFEILVPFGWKYESAVKVDTDIADVVLFGPTEDGFRVNICIVSGFDPDIEETETYLVNTANEVTNYLSSKFGDLQVVQSPICTTINGQAAVTYIVQYQYEGFTIKQKQTIVVSDEQNYYWSITATALAGNYEKYESIFDDTIESFKIQALPSPSLWWVLPVIAVIVFVTVSIFFLLIRRRKTVTPEDAAPTEAQAQLMPKEREEAAPSVEAKKRPTGLTIIAILWFLGGILNLFFSSITISADLEILPLLSDPWVPEWFKFGLPAEIGIQILVFSLGIIQMFTIVGLWTGKSWSYKMALAIPVLAAVSWVSTAGLYMVAPIELGFRESINWVPVGASIFWAIIILSYLRQPHVKEYLRVPIQKTLAEKVPEAPEIPEVPKRQRTLMVIAILAIAIVVVAAGIGLYTLRSPDGEEPSPTASPTPSSTPIEYETYSKYGFSIEYPEDMTITEEGVLDATANDNSGAVGGKSFGPFEEFAVSWVKKSTPATRGDLENALEEIFKLDNFEKTGTIVETTKSGHEMIYQQGTYTEDSQTEYLIYGVWYCNINEKLYVLGVGQTTEQNLLQNFERYLESFVCH